LALALAGCSTTTPLKQKEFQVYESTSAPTAPPTAEQNVYASVVSAADPRAAEAGRDILAKGGNAVDAAMAVMLALTVVEPQSSGLGGGSFALIHDGKTGELTTIDGRETAPKAVTSDLFIGPDGKPMNVREAVAGGKSVGVPGNIRLMQMAHEKHGKLPWKTLFQPAIRLAKDGFTVTPRLAEMLKLRGDMLKSSPEARIIYFDAAGEALPVGATVKNPALAKLLEGIASKGADWYYTGSPAEKIVAAVRGAPKNPSVMTMADMAAYRAIERAPVCTTYRAHRICGMGPPSSGGPAVAAILKQIERFDIPKMGKDSPQAWHLIAESMRLAYADRAQWIGDPGFVAVPTAGLMSDAYLAARSATISPDMAQPKVSFGTPPGAPALAAAGYDPEIAGTSHFSVADAQGNVVSMTSTVESVFGSGLVTDGHVLNNELTDFNFVATGSNGKPSANRVEGGKRPRSSMAPTIVYAPDGKPMLAIGAAGGSTIIAQVAKAVIGAVDWGLSAQAAIALPQLMGSGETVRVEAGTAAEGLIEPLKAKGHATVTAGGFPLKANAVERAPGGWRGGADPRSEGAVRGVQRD
jgi:gamma-glutamyltranspeptidase/glutathione hydrolase